MVIRQALKLEGTSLPHLELEQQLHQHLGLESVQGINLLNMNSLELGEFLRDKALNNPFLALAESEHSVHAHSALRSQHVSAERMIERTQARDSSPHVSWGGAPHETRRDYPFEKHLVSKQTLCEFLSEQAGAMISEEDAGISEQLIGNIDSNGYLRISTTEVAQLCNVPEKRVVNALRRIQQALPAGIGSRNLAECLLLQLEAQNKTSALATRVISRHLDALGRGQIKQVAQACHTTPEQIQEVCNLIQSLNPRPAKEFAFEQESDIWPELELYCEGDGCFAVRHVEALLPKLRIDESYLAFLSNPKLEPKTKTYLSENLRLARGLFDSIEQRQQTMLTVAGAIMYCQQGFCKGGFSAISPLTMAQIAELAKVHESTVSRVVNNTYMQTPHGLAELRCFFSAALSTDEGPACSAVSIKQNLAKMVSAEDSKHPLSDAQLAEIIALDMGVTISRRTINKYRKALGILNYTQRRAY